MLTGANVHDSMVFEELIDAVEPIKRPGRGRPRKRPEKLHADKAYDDKKCKRALRRRRIKSRIARKGIESSEKLGRHRWVVERTLAWLAKYAGSRFAMSAGTTSTRRFSNWVVL
jgi:IS5 family transposase